MSGHFGKYRGRVESNRDPLHLGRLKISAQVLGQGIFPWAMPCVPYAGPNVGFFAIPPEGAGIWVEFEGGDLDYPIWTGCFWGPGQVPKTPAGTPAVAETKVLRTATATITLSDAGTGGITIEAAGMKLVLDATGVEITNGKAKMRLAGPSVSINEGALEVT